MPPPSEEATLPHMPGITPTTPLSLLEADLEQAYFALQADQDSDDDTNMVALEKVCTVVERICSSTEPTTLGDLRLQALALLVWYDDSHDDDRVGRLLERVASLPERLWNEPITTG